MYLKDYLTSRKIYTTQYLIVSRSRDDRLTVDGFYAHYKKIITPFRNSFSLTSA